MFAVEHDEIEIGQRQQVRDPDRRPGQEAAEQRLGREYTLTESGWSCQFSVLSFHFANQRGRHSPNLDDLI